MKFSYISPIFLLLVLLTVSEVSSKRFLFWHVMASYSHRTQTWPIAEALAEQGHDITYISSIKPLGTNPKIKELVPKRVHEVVDEFINGEFDVSLKVDGTMLPMHEFLFEWGKNSCETLMSSPEFQEWLKSEENKKFDLFIVDNCFPECAVGLARYFGAKFIIFNTVLPIPHEYDGIGYLPQSGFIPEMESTIVNIPMGFFDRLYNTYLTLIWRAKHYFYTFKIDEIVRKGLKAPQLPNVGDIFRNVSLIFHTGDVISDYARSLPPLFVNVAGTHVKNSTKALPKDMEIFINSTGPGAKNDGFVYISLGSIVVPAHLPENIKQVFFDTIRAFPNIRFLWRWSGKMPKEIPDNLYISNWFPQIDVLGHPNIKAFVTQNGRPSTLEAINLGVPMISFPVLGDQELNANRLSEMGGTIKLDIGKVKLSELKNAVQKVVYDPAVKQRMTVLQDIFRNRPVPPVETALWWIDYVLKYEDTNHLRTAGYDQYWFVRRQVDVWAFLSISLFIGVVTILFITTKIGKVFSGNNAGNKLKQS